jgi:hypothetical protein
VSLVTRLRPWIEGAAALLAALLPLGFALSLAASSPQWRDDAVVVRGLGLSLAPGAGATSTFGFLALRLLPLGNMAFRASLVASLGLALAGFLLFRGIERALTERQPSLLNSLVALLATCTAVLSPSLLREGSVGGGASVALALGLALLLGSTGPLTARRWAGLGAGLGLLLAENAVLAVVVAAALLVRTLVLRPRTVERGFSFAAAGFAGVALLVLVPMLVRPLAPSSWLGVGLAHGFGDLKHLDIQSLRNRGLGAWISQVGLAAGGLSALGLALGLLRGASRGWALALLVPLGLDLLVPATSSGLLTADPLAPLRQLAFGSAAALSALGLQQIVLFLLSSRLPMARSAGVLALASHAALVTLVAEEAIPQADRNRNLGAEVWTDQAIELLPPSSLLLVRSEALLWRLWAARLGSGMRPDITVVPVPLLGRGKVAGALLREEPALATLLRDVSATGEPSEFGLSTVADVRPLFLELDTRSDRRLASHTTSEALWLRFAPQPYGSSDRRAGRNAATTAFYRVVAAARRQDPHDEATLEVLAAHTRSLAIASALVHDRESVALALDQLAALRRDPPPEDPLWQLLPSSQPPRSKQAHR